MRSRCRGLGRAGGGGTEKQAVVDSYARWVGVRGGRGQKGGGGGGGRYEREGGAMGWMQMGGCG